MVIKKTFDKDLNFIEEKEYVFNTSLAAFYYYFNIDGIDYFEVCDDHNNYLVKVENDEYTYLKFDFNHFWGSTINDGIDIVNGNIYLLTTDKVFIVDTNTLQIKEEYSINDLTNANEIRQASYFTDNYLYDIGSESIYIYDINNFELIASGTHGLVARDNIYSFNIIE